MSLAIASSDCIQSHFVLWARSCSVACLAASHDLLFKKHILARDGSVLIDCKSLSNIDKGTREQVVLYRHFKQELNFDPVKYTAERILKLGLRFFNVHERKKAEHIASCIRRNRDTFHKAKIPPKCLNAVFATWMNAWVTPARFQGKHKRCQFCDNWFSRASLGHYVECFALKRMANHVLGLPIRYNHSQFVCLASEEMTTLTLRAAHLYFCKKTFDTCRHSEFKDFEASYRSHVWQFLVKGGKLPVTPRIHVLGPAQDNTSAPAQADGRNLHEGVQDASLVRSVAASA